MRKAAALIVIGAAALAAQEAVRSGLPYVRATGESTVLAKPDQAIINVGVVTQASTAAVVAAQNARQVAAVLERVKKEIADKGEIRTTGYYVNPNYSSQPSGEAPKITGYQAGNTVEVTLNDIALTGRVIDAATAAGANNIQGIQFAVKDEQAVRRQALRQAAMNARSAAQAMADALGVRVVRVHAAETGEPVMVRPMQEVAMMRMAADARAPTPVEPGNVQVRATVTVTLEVAQ